MLQLPCIRKLELEVKKDKASEKIYSSIKNEVFFKTLTDINMMQ